MKKSDIRPFSAECACRIAEIEAQCFGQNAWSKFAVLDAASREDFIILCAFDGEKCVGYADAFFVLDEMDICNVAVDAAYRREGVGSMLLAALLGWARENGIMSATLDVRPSNTAAKSLYEKHGFMKIGTRRDFYKFPREDAEIYEANLSEISK